MKAITDDLAVNLMRKIEETRAQHMRDSLVEGAMSGLPVIRSKTPVDTGQAKGAWRVTLKDVEGVVVNLENDWPFIQALELGTRPHGVSREGIEALTDWARRRLGLEEMAARGVAYAIAAKYKKVGRPPLYFARDSQAELLALCVDAFTASMQRKLYALGAG